MKPYPIIKQEDKMDCGVASLATMLLYYNQSYSLDYLKKIMDYNSRVGTTLLQLNNTAIKLHCSIEAIYIENINELKSRMLPCIAQITITDNVTHFVVIYKTNVHHLLIADPAYGLKYINRSKYKSVFTGYFLLFPYNLNKKLLSIN